MNPKLQIPHTVGGLAESPADWDDRLMTFVSWARVLRDVIYT